MQAKFFNIKNIILEDNYSANKGDFYSIKHSYQGFGFNHNYKAISHIKTLYFFFNEIMKKIFLKNYNISKDKIISRLKDHKMNKNDFSNIEKNIDIYYEFPPLFFHNENSTKPILENKNIEFEITKEELLNYNNITYIKLK